MSWRETNLCDKMMVVSIVNCALTIAVYLSLALAKQNIRVRKYDLISGKNLSGNRVKDLRA